MGRKASAPPATPGYETEDQDHPAHKPDPNAHQFENGDTSSWAEDPKTPPYPQGNPPSTPGYDTEDQDHPAHEELPRVPKEARSLREQIKAKASKALRVARLMLGENAPDEKVEDQALDLMDLPDEQLVATLNRCGGNPMVADELDGLPEDPMMDDSMGVLPDEELDALLAGEEVPEEEVMSDEELDALLAGTEEEEAPEEVEEEAPKTAMEELARRVSELTDEIKAMKQAGQNAPGGSQNGANAPGKSEEQARAEGEATTSKQEIKTAARKFFASMDTDGDGFVVKAEWLGSPAIFKAADKDKDDIVSEDEVVEELTGGKKAAEEVEDEEVKEEKTEKKAEEEKVEEKVEEKEEGGEEKKACGDTTGCGEMMLDNPEDDAAMFGLQDDPMGLGETPMLSPEDDDLLASVFGKAAKKADDDEVEDKDDKDEVEEKPEEEDEEAKKKAARLAPRTASQKPQPRKASVGPKTVGTQVRTASQSGEVGELSKLWETAPDVSEVFGMK
ncbi:MAG: hypothetical protein WC824_06780 [Bacteroidota bacterium]